MKKVKQLLSMFIIAMLVSSFAVVPGFAAESKDVEFDLIHSGTGYSIAVPNYIEDTTVEYIDEDGELFDRHVIVMETPKQAADGSYPIFEVITQDPDAYVVESYIYTDSYGYLDSFEGEFNNKRLLISPTLTIDGDALEFDEEEVFEFELFVGNEEYDLLFEVYELNFMFVNKDGGKETTKPAPVETTKEETVSAKPTASKVVVNGEQVAFEAYNIGGNNYFKLRDLAAVINGTDKQFEVGWDSVNNAIDLTTGEAYTPDGKELAVSGNKDVKQAKPTKSKIYLNGEELQLTAYNIGGNNYFKLRDIAGAIDFEVTWDAKLSTVGIDTSASYTEPE